MNALPYFDRAYGLLRNSQDAGLRASVGCSRAVIWGSSGHYAEARRVIEDLANGRDTPLESRIECLQTLADLANRSGDSATAQASIQIALRDWEQSPRHSPLLHANLLETLGVTTNSEDHPAASEAIFDQALKELHQLGRERSGLGDILREERIVAVLNSGDPLRALALTNEAVDILAQSNPGQPPVFLVYQRCKILAGLGRDAESLEVWQQLARMTTNFDQQLHERALFGIACALSRLGRVREAEEAYQAAVAAVPVANSRQRIRQSLARSRLDFDEGRYREGRELLEGIVKTADCPTEWRELAFRLLAQADLADYDPAAAMRHGQEALRLGSILQGSKPHSAWIGQSWLTVGRAQSMAGDRQAAMTSFDHAIAELSASLGPEDKLLADVKAAVLNEQRIKG